MASRKNGKVTTVVSESGEITENGVTVESTNGTPAVKVPKADKEGRFWIYVQVPEELKLAAEAYAKSNGFDSDVFMSRQVIADKVGYNLPDEWKSRKVATRAAVEGIDKESMKAINKAVNAALKAEKAAKTAAAIAEFRAAQKAKDIAALAASVGEPS